MRALPPVIVLGVVALGASTAQPAATATPPRTGKAAAAVVAEWGRHSVVTLPSLVVKDLAEDGEGRMIAVGYEYKGTGHGVVIALRRDGSPDPGFGQAGYFRSPSSANLGWDMAVSLPQGRLLIVGATNEGDIDADTHSRLALSELDMHGRLVRSFATDGLYEAAAKSCLRGPIGVVRQGEKVIVAVDRQCTFNSPHKLELIRFDADGTPDRSFGRGGTVPIAQLAWANIPSVPLLVAGSKILVATKAAGRSGTVELIRFNADGSRDRRFGDDGVASTRVAAAAHEVDAVYSLLLGRAGLYTLTGCIDAGPFMARFQPGGAPYRFWPGPNYQPTNVEEFAGAFGSLCAAFAKLPNHKFVVAGNALVLLYPSGYLDPYQPIAALPERTFVSNMPVHGLLVTREGAVLVSTSLEKATVIQAYAF